MAARMGDINFINFLLLQPGVDINATTRDGSAPLSFACFPPRHYASYRNIEKETHQRAFSTVRMLAKRRGRLGHDNIVHNLVNEYPCAIPYVVRLIDLGVDLSLPTDPEDKEALLAARLR
ncbi:hypothetical protein B0H63DRAFT_564687 [Podospora didyma]|uniref:Ankyrin repeat protein n=1 Tax=Podospora didyma TaxID=330526 RepID=A0AAE0N4K7_9PEZI|nr:hypothetical protein B0H63DRAFT_564687 [Podospora didyma]